MRIILITVAAMLLAACSLQPPRPDLVREKIDEEMARAVAERQPVSVPTPAILPPLTVELPGQTGGDTENRFDLSVVNAPAAQVFMALVSGTSYNMLISPEVNGTITLNLKDVTVKEALDAIRELYGYEYSILGRRISIQPNTLQTRLYRVDYLANRRQGSSQLSVTSSSLASGSGSGTTSGTGTTVGSAAGTSSGAGGALAGGAATSLVQTSSNVDFWSDLQTALTTLVAGEGRSVVVNSLSGVVVVRALPAELRVVEQYLNATQSMVGRQVMLEAKIIEVKLSERYQAGINWSSFHGVNNRISVGVTQPGSSLGTTGTGPLGSMAATVLPGVAGTLAASTLGGGFVGLAVQTGNFAALLNFLETQGTVSVLSSPRIATLNNQKALLKVGTDELFVTDVTTTTTTSAAGGTTATPSLTLQPYFSGISLDVTPQIADDGNVILHVHPAVSQVVEKDKLIDLGALGQFKLPLANASVSETDSIVRVQDGHIVAIGGLMTQEQTADNSGLPGSTRSAAGSLFGQRGHSLVKRELVILLKPTVIRDDRAWVRDLEQSGERLRNFELPPLTVPLR